MPHFAAFQVAQNVAQKTFIKSSDNFPNCDLKGNYGVQGVTKPDAFKAEGDANGNSTGNPRYPYLEQVFLTSRIYGGYANGQPTTSQHCLMPEPYAYEYGFAIQRTIVAQINRTTNDYVGDVRYPESAPWVDWGPYIWATA